MTGDEDKDSTSDVALLKLLVGIRQEEYKELSEGWRNLDTKAQGVIALAGILLAAFIALQGAHPSGGYIRSLEQIISIIAVGLLTASMIFSVLSLRLRKVIGFAYFTGSFRSAVEDLLQVQQASRSNRMSDLAREELSYWNECNKDTGSAIDKKALMLTCGQAAIGLSILCLAGIAVLRILE